jgi:hypothetical protein
LKRKSPERDIHRAIVQHLIIRAKPEVLWFHVPNGGSRHIAEAVNLKRLGTLAGVSDLLFFHSNRFCALELKAPGETASDAQLLFQSRWRNAGGYAVVCDDQDRTLNCLNAWEIFR